MTDGNFVTSNEEGKPLVFVKDGAVFANSRDVAEMFEKRHADVLRAIDNVIADLPRNERNFASVEYRAGNGELRRAMDMNRRGFMHLTMGFTGTRAAELKDRYIDAFEAMEAELLSRPQFDPTAVFNDAAAMRGLLLTYTEKVLTLEAEKAEISADRDVKTQALDRIVNADGSLCITDAAKSLQMRPKDLFDYLRSHGWIYRRAGTSHDIGYQSRVVSGDLEHKVTTVLRADGTEKIVEQVRVTSKGLTKLAQLIKPAMN